MKMFKSPAHYKIGGKVEKKMTLLHHLQLRQILNRSDERNSDIRDMLFYILLTEYPHIPGSFLPMFTDAGIGTTPWQTTWQEVRDFIIEHGYDQQGYDKRYIRIVRYTEGYQVIPTTWVENFKKRWGEGRGVPCRDE